MRRLAIIVLAFGLLLSACTKDEEIPIAYNMESFGSLALQGNTILDDSGIIYRIAEKDNGVTVGNSDRVFYVFDILRKTSENQYDIRLKYMFEPLIKNSTTKESADVSELGEDPIKITEGWVSKNYVNLIVSFSYLKDSPTKHSLNLVQDTSSSTDTLRFTLNHNGFGEGEIVEGNPQGLSNASTIVCFDISSSMGNMTSIPIKISAPWYQYNEDGSIAEEKTWVVTKGTYRK